MKTLFKILFIPLCIVLLLLLQFGFIFLLLALLPSLVAYYIDSHTKKTSFKIVFAGNISATIPALVPLLKANLHMRHIDTMSVFHDPSVWLFIYLGAAAGWCVIFLCRYIARLILGFSFNHRIRLLQREQKFLVAEWGDGIADNVINSRK